MIFKNKTHEENHNFFQVKFGNLDVEKVYECPHIRIYIRVMGYFFIVLATSSFYYSLIQLDMKTLFTILLTFFSLIGFAQIDYKKNAKSDLGKIKKEFELAEQNLEKAKDSLNKLSSSLSPSLNTFYGEVVKKKGKTDSLYKASKVIWAFYAQKGVNKDSLNSFFEIPENYTSIEVKKEKKPENEVFLLFGDDRLVLKEKVIKDSLVSDIFRNVLKSDSESHLGDFWFPKNGQQIPITRLIKKCEKNLVGQKKDTTCEDKIDIKYLGFDKVEIDLYEGSLIDIKIYLKDKKGSIHLFENRRSISLLHYTSTSQKFYLKNKAQQTYRDQRRKYNKYELRLSDVLRYFSKPGRNFIPDDQSFTFPITNKDGKTNKDAPNVYELRQSTSLENVLDLRAYTDFLGLFDETPNGIALFEGQADFFVNPFRTAGTPFFFFKKVKPYVAYARLDDDDRFLELSEIDTTTNTRMISNRLDHIQKSYLDMGVKFDVVNFTLGKEYPFEVSLYSVARYQVARIKTDTLNTFNYKTLGAGAGVNFEFRRFDNFDFSYSMEFSRYNQDSYNNIEGIIEPDDFWVFRNEAEVSYYPASSKNNAIFVRLKIFDDLDSEEGSNFFQFQFGYKFTVGVQKVKSKI